MEGENKPAWRESVREGLAVDSVGARLWDEHYPAPNQCGKERECTTLEAAVRWMLHPRKAKMAFLKIHEKNLKLQGLVRKSPCRRAQPLVVVEVVAVCSG